jgi:hypothetical protein
VDSPYPAGAAGAGGSSSSSSSPLLRPPPGLPYTGQPQQYNPNASSQQQQQQQSPYYSQLPTSDSNLPTSSFQLAPTGTSGMRVGGGSAAAGRAGIEGAGRRELAVSALSPYVRAEQYQVGAAWCSFFCSFVRVCMLSMCSRGFGEFFFLVLGRRLMSLPNPNTHHPQQQQHNKKA